MKVLSGHKPTLIATLGLPASGKSSWAREQQAEDPTIVTVSKDDLRAMLHNSVWNKQNEAQVIRVRNAIVKDALRNGRSVIVHDTNFGPHVKDLQKMAEELDADFRVRDFTHVPLDECIERDKGRSASVGEDVILRMHSQYLEGEPRGLQQSATECGQHPQETWG